MRDPYISGLVCLVSHLPLFDWEAHDVILSHYWYKVWAYDFSLVKIHFFLFVIRDYTFRQCEYIAPPNFYSVVLISTVDFYLTHLIYCWFWSWYVVYWHSEGRVFPSYLLSLSFSISGPLFLISLETSAFKKKKSVCWNVVLSLFYCRGIFFTLNLLKYTQRSAYIINIQTGGYHYPFSAWFALRVDRGSLLCLFDMTL